MEIVCSAFLLDPGDALFGPGDPGAPSQDCLSACSEAEPPPRPVIVAVTNRSVKLRLNPRGFHPLCVYV